MIRLASSPILAADVGQENMKTSLSRLFAIVLVVGSVMLTAAVESSPQTSAPPALVETESTNATYMLQLVWQTHPTNTDVREEQFWFREPEADVVVTNTDGTISTRSQGARRGSRTVYGDGPAGYSRVSVGVKDISRTNVLINVRRAWGSWKETNTANQVTQMLDVPLCSSDLVRQGQIEFKTKWWRIAQPTSAGAVASTAPEK